MNPYEALAFVKHCYPNSYVRHNNSGYSNKYIVMAGEYDKNGDDQCLTGWAYSSQEDAWINAKLVIEARTLRKFEEE